MNRSSLSSVLVVLAVIAVALTQLPQVRAQDETQPVVPLLEVTPEPTGIPLFVPAEGTAVDPVTPSAEEVIDPALTSETDGTLGSQAVQAPPGYVVVDRLPWDTTQQSSVRVSRTGRLYKSVYDAQGLTFYDYRDYHPAMGAMTNNQRGAIDFSIPTGTRVLAVASGTVTKATSCEVNVRHANGMVSIYLHLSRVDVKSGAVSAGQQIGLSGNSCKSEGPHLHFALMSGRKEVPVAFSNVPAQTSNGKTCPASVICPSKTNYVEFRYGSGGGGGITPTPTPPPNVSCPDGQYKAEYYNNRTLSGSPTVTRCESSINYDWGSGSPAGGIGADNFSVRWTGRHNFSGGNTRFIAVADDGIRVYLDGGRIIDAWKDQGATEYRAERNVGAGMHEVKVEYYENGGGATARLRWEYFTIPQDPPFSGNPVSTLTVSTAEVRLSVCADNVPGRPVYATLYRGPANGYPEKIWRYTGNSSSRCVTFTNMDGAGNTFAGVTYYTVASLRAISDGDAKARRTSCFTATGGYQLCDGKAR